MDEKRPALPALTGLRFVAALWVMAYHFSTYLLPGLLGTGAVAEIAARGYAGINVFFVLSGFILTYTYLRHGTFASTLARYVVARVARLYPLYLLSLAVIALPALWHAFTLASPVTTIPATLLLQVAWLPTEDLTWAMQGWTISVELVFYALFPFLLPVLARWPVARLWRTLLASWLLSLLAPALFVLAHPATVGGIWTASDHWWLNFLHRDPFLQCPEFLCGMILGVLFVRGRLPAPSRLVALVAFVAAISALIWVTTRRGYLWEMTIPNGLLTPVIAILIWVLADARNVPARVLGSRAGVRLGEASYALYLFHMPLWYLAMDVLRLPRQLAGGPPQHILFLVYLAALLAICRWLYCRVESPARRLLRSTHAIFPANSVPASSDLYGDETGSRIA